MSVRSLGIWAPDHIEEKTLSEKLECFIQRLLDTCGGELTDSTIFSQAFG
ncbi:MAG: hypothetical protein U5R06_15655 [candidate division KSB1 bacterium]|nr:hypothetical protein [candidate division KSB1 bacterium]